MHLRRLTLFVVFLGLLICRNSVAQNADSVIDRYLRSVGGVERLAKIHTAHFETTTWKWDSTQMGTDHSPEYRKSTKPFFQEVTLRQPYNRVLKLRDSANTLLTSVYSNSDYVRTVDYTKWKKGVISTVPVTWENPPTKYFIHHAEELLTHYRYYKVTLGGVETVNGVTCVVLMTPGVNGSKSPCRWYFDQASGLLVFRKSDDQPQDIIALSDYREADGIRFPFLLRVYRNGVLYSQTETRLLKLGVPAGDEEFYYLQPTAHHHANNMIEDNELVDFKALIEKHFKGQRLLVDLWSPSCRPCLEQFQRFDEAFYADMDKRNVMIVYLNIDMNPNTWREAVNNHPVKGTHVLITFKLHESMRSTFYKRGIMTIPRYALIDTDGSIVASDFVSPEAPNFKSEMDKYFAYQK